MERSSSSHISRSSCTGGKLGGMNPKENLAPSAVSCIEGETGALATLRMPRNDLGLSDTNGLKVSICLAALKVGTPMTKSRFQLQLIIEISTKRGIYLPGETSDICVKSKRNHPLLELEPTWPKMAE